MSRVRLEFTVEPFRDADPGPHVRAAPGVAASDHPRLRTGRIVASDDGGPGARASTVSGDGVAPLLDAIEPVAQALGGRVVDAAEVTDGDIPLTWQGTLVGGLRVPRSLADLRHALADSIAAVERDLDGPLRSLSREDKQRAVRLLDERGVFVLRKSIEDVADAMGVSRMTIYTYLDAIHRD